MRARARAICCFAVVGAAAGLAASADAKPNVAKEVAKINSAYHDAVAKRDSKAVANLYAPNARFVSPAIPPVKGRAAIKKHIEDLFAKGLCSFTITQSELTIRGDVAIGFGVYTERVCGAIPSSGGGAYVLMYQRQKSGALKIRYDIFNATP
jgi:ketosteroid isomerase-like protein